MVIAMELDRVREEVIEILTEKLNRLPPMSVGDAFNFNDQIIAPDITDDPLDIAEVTMALEDAFGILFDDKVPGDSGLETVKDVVEHIHELLNQPAAE